MRVHDRTCMGDKQVRSNKIASKSTERRRLMQESGSRDATPQINQPHFLFLMFLLQIACMHTWWLGARTPSTGTVSVSGLDGVAVPITTEPR